MIEDERMRDVLCFLDGWETGAIRIYCCRFRKLEAAERERKGLTEEERNTQKAL
jgi:hypothetical protein